MWAQRARVTAERGSESRVREHGEVSAYLRTMMTRMVMTAARKTNPPKMPSAMTPVMFRRASGGLGEPLCDLKMPELSAPGISFKCVDSCGLVGLDAGLLGCFLTGLGVVFGTKDDDDDGGEEGELSPPRVYGFVFAEEPIEVADVGKRTMVGRLVGSSEEEEALDEPELLQRPPPFCWAPLRLKENWTVVGGGGLVVGGAVENVVLNVVVLGVVVVVVVGGASSV